MIRICLSIWLCSVAFACANLWFHKTHQTVHATTDSDEVFAVFSFENKGNKPVQIVDYHTPCANCLNLAILPDTLLIKPGARGRIRATFKTGTFSGTSQKSISIWLKGDSKKNPSIQLSVEIIIPQLIKVTPNRLTWSIGDSPVTKVLRVEVLQKQPVEMGVVTCTNEIFKITKKIVVPGFTYEYHVTPLSTKQFGYGVMRAQTNLKNPKFKSIQSYLMVKKTHD